MATDAEKIVTEFCNAWPRKNVDELLGFFTDDAVYHNIPLEPAKGKDAIRGVINTFLPMAKSLHFKILNIRQRRQRRLQRTRRHLRPRQRQKNRTPGRRRVRSDRLKNQRLARLLRHANVHETNVLTLIPA